MKKKEKSKGISAIRELICVIAGVLFVLFAALVIYLIEKDEK